MVSFITMISLVTSTQTFQKQSLNVSVKDATIKRKALVGIGVWGTGCLCWDLTGSLCIILFNPYLWVMANAPSETCAWNHIYLYQFLVVFQDQIKVYPVPDSLFSSCTDQILMAIALFICNSLLKYWSLLFWFCLVFSTLDSKLYEKYIIHAHFPHTTDLDACTTSSIIF